jgi:hypothetical protein
VVHRERCDQTLRRFTPHVLEAADVAAGQRAIDGDCCKYFASTAILGAPGSKSVGGINMVNH